LSKRSAGLVQKTAPAAKSISSKAAMHFSVYLMIAALALLGVEVAYALYQLTVLVL